MNKNPEEITRSQTDRQPRGYRGTSMQTGAFQFIPVPFVDDWLIARWRRRMVASALKERGIAFEPKVPRILTRWANRSLFGRVRSSATGLILKPLRKIFRTVFIWLAARNAVLTTTETFFLGRFVQHHGLTNAFKGNVLSNDDAERLSDIFAQVIEKIDRRVAGQVANRIWTSLRDRIKRDETDRFDTDDIGEVMENEAPGILADFDERVTVLLRQG